MEPTEVIIEDKKEDEIDEMLQNTRNSKESLPSLSSIPRHNIAHKRLSRDDTLRGKMRRFVFKVYSFLALHLDRLIDLLTIHSSKFALFAIFLVSVSKPNLFNACLFVMFLWLSLTS